ncbi:guanylate cyclase 2G-like protein [Labeo rohita]|uniref:Guanylate cyclase 2G-like protein n=1 Tax=Labeo rohita TaxID=84645 RepID=A0A498LJ95_LABRO|nr:guanylate cyclase 2G-like protein [Labeo rohita]
MQADSPFGQQGLFLAGEEASALHAMMMLQVFQDNLLQSLEGRAIMPDTANDLRVATDFVLMKTKHATQATGRAMGFMVVQQRHLWLNP